MRLTLLVDNIAGEGLRAEHGLSFLIETDSGGVLFDTGQTSAWLDNLARFLDKTVAGQITCCHCTGREACEHLHRKLGPRVTLGQSGMSWDI